MTSSPTSPRGSRSRTGRVPGRAAGPVSGSRAGTRPSSRSTARTAARSSSRATGRAAGPSPEPPQPPRSRFTGRAAVLILVVAVLMVSYASSMRAYLRQQHHLEALQTNIHHAKTRIAALRREKERWHDRHYVEAQARARFGWVLPGEIGYQVIGRDGQLLNQTDPLAEPASAHPAVPPTWWQSAWGSVQEAGNPPQQKPTPAARPTPARKLRLR